MADNYVIINLTNMDYFKDSEGVVKENCETVSFYPDDLGSETENE